MKEIAAMDVGVVVLSWWGRPDVPGTTDTQGSSPRFRSGLLREIQVCTRTT